MFGEPVLLFTNYCDEQYQLHPRSPHSHHEMVEILYILRDSGVFEINGTPYPVHSGDLVIYNSDAVHNEASHFPPPPLYGLEATGIQLEGLPSNWLIPPDTSPVISLGDHASEFRHLFRTIYDQSAKQTENAGMTCQYLFCALLHMIQELIDGNIPVHAGTNEDSKANQLGRQIQIYVDEHVLENLSVQSVADHFDISSAYLFRLFKQVTGTSLMQYIIQRRIGEAQTLLLITDLSITEVAQKVGYDNLSHFVKMFTQNVGLSPRKYRKQAGVLYTKQL
ncbi:helix-turn-helix domain-containing protein [Butyricicoccus sp.]|uniref:helix-turn-helix transcriptional regulator n=1 Tax=Butyricicoccus sp. TaxID=2049021 RepID=UPI003F181139